MKKSIFLEKKANGLRTRINSAVHSLNALYGLGLQNKIEFSLDDLLSNRGSASRMKLKNHLTTNLPDPNDFEITRQQREEAEGKAYQTLSVFDKSSAALKSYLQGLTAGDFYQLKEGKIQLDGKAVEAFLKKSCTHNLTPEEAEYDELIDRLVAAKRKGFNPEHYIHNGREFCNCFENHLNQVYNKTYF